MKVAVVGSRNFNDYSYMHEVLQSFDYLKFEITEIVSGGARGADSLAERYARENNLPMKVFAAEWDKYGKSAGYKRNKLIVDYADVVFAFWDGESKGTQHSINLAKEQGKLVNVYTNWKNNGTI
jgi:predicted Rossmann fold nucleotide-binding protein DprA/Smf involved in DNA uptake